MEKPSRSNLRFNFNLVAAEIERWPVTTFLIASTIAGGTAINAIAWKLNTIDFAIMFIGYFCGCLGLKAASLVTFYPTVYGTRFPGSSVIAMFIAMIPIFVFYAATFYVISLATGKTLPIEVVTLFLPFCYVVFSLFFGGFASLLNWIHRPKASR